MSKSYWQPAATSSSAHRVTLNAMICAVIVVPTLAPRITPIAWERFIRPDETNPTTRTVVTEDDWMTAVTKAPVTCSLAATPRTRMPVSPW